jgi:hypothetical protein
MFEIESGLPFKILDLVYKFQIICVSGTWLSFWMESKCSMYDGCTDMGKTSCPRRLAW